MPGGQRTPLHWIIFAVLTVLWASAYPGNRLAVNLDDPAHGFPPQLVTALRLGIGAVILMAIALWRKERFPRLSDWRRWGTLFVLGFVGMTAPFLAITTAQKTVDSSLAALYVAAAPLFVAGLAHFFFAAERLTRGVIAGLVVGFAGIALLFGPDAITSFGSASVWAQALCLLATAFYAITTITARGAPPMPPIMMSAAFVTLAAVLALPPLVTVDFSVLDPAPSAYVGVAVLAIMPTAMASFLYMWLVARTSATFLALTGYTIPVVTAIIAFILFGEVQSLRSVAAYVLILCGVWLSQRPTRPPAE